MKKDPLTQMSINSFFPASAIKREPEDNNEIHEQNAKKRKIDNAEVMCKSEPMEIQETESTSQQVNVKQEPQDYCDSEDNTEAESDEEVDTNKLANIKRKIKTEDNSDNDTDKESDEETANLHLNVDKGKGQSNKKPPQNPLNIQRETGESHGKVKQSHVHEQRPCTEPTIPGMGICYHLCCTIY